MSVKGEKRTRCALRSDPRHLYQIWQWSSWLGDTLSCRAFILLDVQCRTLMKGMDYAGRVTDDIIRSLLIAQELLQTKEIVLMHHTGTLHFVSLV